ncbi:MAG: type II toxin-antitoxin system HicB family antitoxin [Betaproteobacteria bacterium]|nr:type II toxin-antitoxin system HicB family antitoxin [Betaproteobacteria bacterium]
MSLTYTANGGQDGASWAAWIDIVPLVNAPQSTRDELLKTLRITLGEVLKINRPPAVDCRN